MRNNVGESNNSKQQSCCCCCCYCCGIGTHQQSRYVTSRFADFQTFPRSD